MILDKNADGVNLYEKLEVKSVNLLYTEIGDLTCLQNISLMNLIMKVRVRYLIVYFKSTNVKIV